jgi:predicted phosphodiesterase
MRVFAVSDLHVDYDANAKWVEGLSRADHRDDLLILAGDLTDRLPLLAWCLRAFAERFRKVLFVPGNHDLWVHRDGGARDSLGKFADVRAAAEDSGVSMRSHREPGLVVHPVLGWYDHSFGEPQSELRAMWMDFRACRWPEGFDADRIAAHFDACNDAAIDEEPGGCMPDDGTLDDGMPDDSMPDDGRTRADRRAGPGAMPDMIITFSHFLPRIDVMPWYIPGHHRILYPVLGSTRIEARLRRLRSALHVYGHSHVNRDLRIDGVRYVNNAFGYPGEGRIASRRLVCIHER